MGTELRRLSRRRKTRDKMDRILDHPEDALVIHYWLFVEECENPYTNPLRRTVLLESA